MACFWLQAMYYCRVSPYNSCFPLCLKPRLFPAACRVSVQHSQPGCAECSSGHSPPCMLSGILHFSQSIRERRKGSEALFIQFRSNPLSLCYTSNRQTPLHSTRRGSVIPEKEMTRSSEIKKKCPAVDEYILGYSTRKFSLFLPHLSSEFLARGWGVRDEQRDLAMTEL